MFPPFTAYEFRHQTKSSEERLNVIRNTQSRVHIKVMNQTTQQELALIFWYTLEPNNVQPRLHFGCCCSNNYCASSKM